MDFKFQIYPIAIIGCLLISMTFYLLSLKVDHFIQISWIQVFIPVWIFSLFLVILSTYITFFILKLWYQKNLIFRRLHIKQTSIPKILITLWSYTLSFGLFIFLLTLKLENDISISWWYTLLPLFILILLIGITVHINPFSSQSKIFNSMISIAMTLVLFTLFLLTARLDGDIMMNWCVPLSPLWLADILICIAPLTCIRALGTQKYPVIIVVGAYWSIGIVLRSFLCSMLVHDDGKDGYCTIYQFKVFYVQYPYILVLIPIHGFCLIIAACLLWVQRNRISDFIQKVSSKTDSS